MVRVIKYLINLSKIQKLFLWNNFGKILNLALIRQRFIHFSHLQRSTKMNIRLVKDRMNMMVVEFDRLAEFQICFLCSFLYVLMCSHGGDCHVRFGKHRALFNVNRDVTVAGLVNVHLLFLIRFKNTPTIKPQIWY